MHFLNLYAGIICCYHSMDVAIKKSFLKFKDNAHFSYFLLYFLQTKTKETLFKTEKIFDFPKVIRPLCS